MYSIKLSKRRNNSSINRSTFQKTIKNLAKLYFRRVFDDCRRWSPIVSRGSMPSFIQNSISIMTREPVCRGFSNFLRINLRVHGARFYTRIAPRSSAPSTTASRYVISARSLLEKSTISPVSGIHYLLVEFRMLNFEDTAIRDRFINQNVFLFVLTP